MRKLLFYATFFGVVSLQAQQTYLHCGKIIDTDKGKVLTEKTLVISDGKIQQVNNGYTSPGNGEDTVIDLKDKTVLPGFVDMHVHLESETNPKRYMARYTDNEADVAFQSVVYAKKTLMAGFTTVRDLGGSGVNTALRNAINKGYVVGPRIFSAGKSIATTGGHADPTNGSRKALMGDPGPKEGVVNSPEEARKAVRQRYKNGADVIKITATGGVLSVAKSGRNPQFFLDEIKAITETAADYGMLVAAHAHGDRGMQRAILGGVKTIEHGTFMSEETMELMKKHNAYYVPTITAGKEVAEKAEVEGYYPELVVPKAKEVGPQIQGTFAKAYKKGVNIVFGTDAGVFKHGENAREFQYMVEAGMPEMEAIRSATVTPAILLDMQHKTGQLKEGFLADIIAVNEDPTQNIKTLQNVVFVMKGGVVHKNEDTAP
ncbi:metal-dependent hydrolase family protein [Sinomicrobium weinanense]|uniref:Amidohydrolase family protein n=1 Tax=Sinomicrobium weinanense TaxID=2842200 RepID=A0A926JNC9_9FLAO|nr:amidohydrolase family protein [Sinomicrobium weinanense]MBC9794386.1 amidohydrolase family protein [Sinomicrobium weinanense]MBU3124293.1 amidohydrolase family protein [Sinomicrobium weinanense]